MTKPPGLAIHFRLVLLIPPSSTPATLLVEGKHALKRLPAANEIARPARYLASDRRVIPIP